ncbi:two-component system, chemotaxis family, response regulator CheB [Andreprevotia lacus DSM 23236]|jgi:two-component system chemotaxis response regulator CheB|uniref:Protein-glutamate methylesterase/protein-glutamine glutaminase n=1 Tax=Andreprevotia lacus DSM 23236 TaxID=1121001 RepID=A0A1W1XDA8_9NEIS|nr:chemotaxis-specific protein-glutamate methyltransferase CheB [Andreprevotia lacus]SMC22015.1 two-component system, chemotaxis family, response regulator CheB [Andreprevotia lacus DSM 23236]
MSTRILIIDHSPIARLAMSDALKAVPGFEVVGLAGDPHGARSLFRSMQPDVVVIDVDIPGTDSVVLLKALQSERRVPAVAVASSTERSNRLALQTMEHGAIAVVSRHSIMMRQIQDNSANLVQAVRSAAISRGARQPPPRVGAMAPAPRPAAAPLSARAISPLPTPAGRPAPPSAPTPAGSQGYATNASVSVINERMSGPKQSPDMLLPPPRPGAVQPTSPVIAIGASTGGVQALEAILPGIPANSPPIVIVQHMPENFTANFAARLNSLSKIEVKQAAHGDKLRPGLALVAPGGKHLIVKRNGMQYYVDVVDGPLITRHRPSVDVLFRSTASAAGQNGVGFLLTGMGDDGARCLREMRDCGAMTYAQDEKTCTVFGMPREAIRMGAAVEIVPLQQIAGLIGRYAGK